MKVCSKCKEEKPLKSFYKRRDRVNGYKSQCISCSNKESKNYYNNNRKKRIEYRRRYQKLNPKKVKDTQIKYKYGITIEKFDQMYQKQGGVCKICGMEETAIHNKTKKIRALCIDHNHVSGEIRGLLCSECNRMLGRARDNPLILIKGAKYLGNKP